MEKTTLPRFGLFNTEAHILHSNIADQDFQIGVWFPFSYHSSNRAYPVLYVPDGEFAFPAAVGLIPTLMGAGEVPEMLVVGIAYDGITNWAEHGALRDRDFCTAKFQTPPHETRHQEFKRFFQEELFPLVESHYRTDPGDRALFGFSSAGFFTLHMLLSQPGMFRRHVAASCTWPGADEFFLERAARYAEQPDHPVTDLYLAIGGCDEGQLPGFHRLVEMLASEQFSNLRLNSAIFEGEGHTAGVISKTFLAGLKATFSK